MNQKPEAPDWELIREGLEFSQSLELYWHKNQVYCTLSAHHNGLIGMGYIFKQLKNQKD